MPVVARCRKYEQSVRSYKLGLSRLSTIDKREVLCQLEQVELGHFVAAYDYAEPGSEPRRPVRFPYVSWSVSVYLVPS